MGLRLPRLHQVPGAGGAGLLPRLLHLHCLDGAGHPHLPRHQQQALQDRPLPVLQVLSGIVIVVTQDWVGHCILILIYVIVFILFCIKEK